MQARTARLIPGRRPWPRPESAEGLSSTRVIHDRMISVLRVPYQEVAGSCRNQAVSLVAMVYRDVVQHGQARMLDSSSDPVIVRRAAPEPAGSSHRHHISSQTRCFVPHPPAWPSIGTSRGRSTHRRRCTCAPCMDQVLLCRPGLKCGRSTSAEIHLSCALCFMLCPGSGRVAATADR
ncbi:hypothetical protein VTN02DRAFT_4721 [Thermoascus thermophilus]